MKKMPAHLPPLPDGAVYLGRGGEFAVPGDRMGGWACSDTPPRHWLYESHTWKGNGKSNHYAAPADSEIARLNGCGKPSWDEAPEWAEWLAQDKDGEWCWYENKPGLFDEMWDVGAGGDYRNDVKGPRNPNWRDTLERRPGKPFYKSLHDAESEIRRIEHAMRGALGAMLKEGYGTTPGDPADKSETIRWAVETPVPPDLLIPKDAAEMMNSSGYVSALSEIGYRLEIDKGGIRGWKE